MPLAFCSIRAKPAPWAALASRGIALDPTLVLEGRSSTDDAERERLSRISTNFDLEGGQVDALVAAGRALLRANPEFRGLLDALGGKPAN